MTTITIDRAVVEQALDILDSEFTSVDGEFCRWCDSRLTNARHSCKLEQAITALRAALAEPVQAEPDAAYQQWLQESHAPALRRMDSQGAFAAGWHAALEQALEALEMCRLNGSQYLYGHERDLVFSSITALRAALAQEQAEPTVKNSLQVPAEVAATLTTTDIAWLETRRLTKLWQELGQMRWAGADEGWDRAIEAVRSRLNDECQAVLNWKAMADQSSATAIELLQKMQGLKHD